MSEWPEDQYVIHKQTLQMTADVQELTVPANAHLVSLGMDTRSSDIAVWYRFIQARDTYTGPNYTKLWRLSIVGTGHPFPAKGVVLGTVVMGAFAWHVVDLDAVVSR